MGHFSPPEPQTDFHFIALLYKTSQVAHLDLVIGFLSTGPELNLLNLGLLLLLLGRLRLFRHFKAVFAVVHNSTYGWFSVRYNLYEIKTRFLGQRLGFCKGLNTHLFTVISNDPDFRGQNFLVTPSLFMLGD